MENRVHLAPETPKESESPADVDALRAAYNQGLALPLTMPADVWQQADWLCVSCQYMNIAVRTKCRNCRKPRVDPPGPGSQRIAVTGDSIETRVLLDGVIVKRSQDSIEARGFADGLEMGLEKGAQQHPPSPSEESQPEKEPC